MKKVSMIKAVTLFFGVLLLTASLFQCKKTGDIISNLDRSYKNVPDSTVYASFYDKYTLPQSDAVPKANDIVQFRGVQTIIHEYCGTSNCHGGSIKPKFDTYADIMKVVVSGNPGSSKLWEYITTNDFDKAMPPVNSNHELNNTDKGIIFNWIVNGAKEYPNLADFRPAAVRIIMNGCGSANCHNQATATGAWARAGLIGPISNGDTTTYTYTNPSSGSVTLYCQLSNPTLRNQVWTAYKDSVKKFYSDTVAFASFRPWKKFSTPRSASSTRGPLQNYDDILMDIHYPKGQRSSNSVQYTDPSTNIQYYVSGNPLNSGSSIVFQVDSNITMANPFTKLYPTSFIGTSGNTAGMSNSGKMSWDDGGLKPAEIALIKAWYFADPNIPDVWKYGTNNVGIFKYWRSGKVITKQ